MPIPNQNLNRELKSGSDFEQWLAEINLFAHETLAELHDVAGVLNVALAGGHPTPTPSYTSRESQVPGQPNNRAQLASTPSNAADGSSDDPLVMLQNKIARQLRANMPTPNQPDTEHASPDANSSRDRAAYEFSDKPGQFFDDRPY